MVMAKQRLNWNWNRLILERKSVRLAGIHSRNERRFLFVNPDPNYQDLYKTAFG